MYVQGTEERLALRELFPAGHRGPVAWFQRFHRNLRPGGQGIRVRLYPRELEAQPECHASPGKDHD